MKNISVFSVALAITYWVVESMMDTLVIPQVSLTERLLFPDANELWMRLMIIGLIISFGAYAQSSVEKIKKSDERLQRMNSCFLDFGPDPTENIGRLTALCSELTGASTVFYERLELENLLSSIQEPGDNATARSAVFNSGEDDSSLSEPLPGICNKLLSRNEDVLITHGPDLNPACPARKNPIPTGRGFTCMRKAVSLGHELVGSLCVVFFSDFSPSEDDKRLVNIIASAIGVEEVRRRSQAALRESEERLRFLSSELLNAQEFERKHLAHQLHDSVGQSLSALKFSIEETLELLNGEVSVEKIRPLSASVPLIREIVGEIRRIQRDLFPPTLDELGIVAAINSFCKQYRDIYHTIRLEHRIEVKEDEVPKQLKTVIYRIMQEAMNNIAKHSDAGAVLLSLKRGDASLQLVIQDDGHGFDAKRAYSVHFRKGLGLSSMRERAELSGGSFRIQSQKGNGTRIEVSWPLQDNILSGVSI